MASATAFDTLAFVAAALSALTEKHIVTKTEFDRISEEIKSGINHVYVCAGEMNVVEEVKLTYAKTAMLVAQRHNPYMIRNMLELSPRSDEIWKIGENLNEKTWILNKPETNHKGNWYHGLCCLGDRSVSTLRNSKRLKQSNPCTQTKASHQVQRTAQTIDLFVVVPLGMTITVEMESTHSLVINIKYTIMERLGITVTEQFLHFGGRLLEDGKSLYEYKIKANSTIHLSVKGRGGAKESLFYIDSTHLDPSWDFDFTNLKDNGEKYKRGRYPYYRPYGWRRIALKVKGKYANDQWLGEDGIRTKQSPGEWAVTYHGTKSEVFNKIAEEGFIVGPRKAYGAGVYSSPNINTAHMYASNFSFQGTQYIALFQNRVNPKGVKIKNDRQYWVCPNKDDIRPYGLCVKKLN